MSKNKKYYLLIDGKFMEVESIIEIKNQLSAQDWENVVAQTADAYVQMKVVDDAEVMGIGLDDNDKKIMEGLKRAIDVIRSIDPTTCSKYYNDEMVETYKKILLTEIEKYNSSLKVGYGTPPGIVDISMPVSRVDKPN